MKSPLTTMSDLNDRPLAPASRDQDAPEAAAVSREADAGIARPDLRAATGKRPVSLWLPIGVGALAILAAVAFWLDGRRTHQSLRMEVAQRLSGIESSTQAAGKAQMQLATDLRDAQAKIRDLSADEALHLLTTDIPQLIGGHRGREFDYSQYRGGTGSWPMAEQHSLATESARRRRGGC